MLLLDVDGVLNPYGAVGCPDGYAEHALFAGEEPVRLCAGHGAWINELADAYDVVWATAWGADADRLLAPLLGLPRFPAVELPPAPFPPGAKVPAVDRVVGHRPAAWIDDELGAPAREWAARRAAPTLLLPADPAVGLTRALVDEALAWAARHAAD